MARKIKGEVAEYIDSHYKETSAKTMSELLLQEFGVEVEKSTVLNYYKKHGYKSGLDGRFQKGQPSSKGMQKGQKAYWMTPEKLENIQKTQFKKGSKPKNTTFVGDERLRSDGTVYVKIADRVWREKHRIVWEEHYGCKLTKSEHIVHLDGNKQNNDISNLAKITEREERIISAHRRFTDDPNINKAIILNTRLKVKLKEKQND